MFPKGSSGILLTDTKGGEFLTFGTMEWSIEPKQGHLCRQLAGTAGHGYRGNDRGLGDGFERELLHAKLVHPEIYKTDLHSGGILSYREIARSGIEEIRVT